MFSDCVSVWIINWYLVVELVRSRDLTSYYGRILFGKLIMRVVGIKCVHIHQGWHSIPGYYSGEHPLKYVLYIYCMYNNTATHTENITPDWTLH